MSVPRRASSVLDLAPGEPELQGANRLDELVELATARPQGGAGLYGHRTAALAGQMRDCKRIKQAAACLEHG
eukprot:14465554-Alexandrium_andersonii.AAC.1